MKARFLVSFACTAWVGLACAKGIHDTRRTSRSRLDAARDGRVGQARGFLASPSGRVREPFLVRDRATDTLTAEFPGALVAALYGTAPGRVALKAVLARPWFSRAAGRLCDTRISARAVVPFARAKGIDLAEWESRRFASFNDFFARSLPVRSGAGMGELVAIAEARLSAYPIGPGLEVEVKGGPYTLAELTGGTPEVAGLAGGTCLVFRLGVDNYHRFVHADAGRLVSRTAIAGELRTVQPIPGNEGVYRRNARVVSVLETEVFGRMVEVDVGATLVARIVDRERAEFARLEEKGHFEFGGSTVVLLVGPQVRIDADLLEASACGIETAVRLGERIGELA